MNDQELQEKYVLYQILSQTLETLKQQVQLLENQKMDIQITRDALNDVGKLKGENEIMIPLGSGCYAKGRILDGNSFLVNIGSGVVIGKDSKEMQAFLDAKQNELDDAGRQVTDEIAKANQKLDELSVEIQHFMSRKSQEKPKA